ncbi:MAG: hypothetical protein H8E44_09655 [Planctomycetes bacterium]|nr:hypothetical protein [Planctomycetota bacterium]MBL7039074.1 hypothetical protein [Pirellulaceae bacterium]
MRKYDTTNFDPPAPVVQVDLRSPESGELVGGVELLLDSGADVTLLPTNAVGQLGVATDSTQRYELMGFDGSRSLAHGVILDVLLLGRAFRGLYLLTEDTRGVIGRDVLNHLAIVLDGPALRWDTVSE